MVLVDKPISRSALQEISKSGFGNLVKAVVDIQKNLMALGASLHSDEESFLLENGSNQPDLWGINLYPDLAGENFIEFDSMINLRPGQNNHSRSVDDPKVREKISAVVNRLVS